MRIHWSLVLLAVIGTILITWHFRTKDMDFLTPEGVELPPTRDEAALATADPALQPAIKKKTLPGDLIPKEEPEPDAPTLPAITAEDLGDLESGPGLEEYRNFALAKTPDQLFELSSTLRARGHFQRALLALERVVDTAASSPEALAEAGRGIAALTPTLPPWNIDPESEIALDLHLSLARPASQALEKALLALAVLIRESSGDQIKVRPQVASADNDEAPADSPVALWLSSTREEPVASSVITVRLPADPEALVPELSLGLFQAIRSHLTGLGFPEARPLELSGPELLQTQITRLMWRDFARSLVPLASPEASTESESEDSGPISPETD